MRPSSSLSCGRSTVLFAAGVMCGVLTVVMVTRAPPGGFFLRQVAVPVSVQSPPTPAAPLSTQRPLLSVSNMSHAYTVEDCLTRRAVYRVPSPPPTTEFTSKLRGGGGSITTWKGEEDRERVKSFEEIFNKRVWAPAGNDEFADVRSSGPGSRPDATVETVGALKAVFTYIKEQLGKERLRVLDVPCGDMLWMSFFLRSRTDIEYVGLDVVQALVEKHRKRYAHIQRWSFHQHDIVAKSLEELQPFDLIFSRQMTQHLLTVDTLLTLEHFSSSGSTYLLITDYPEVMNQELNARARYRFRTQNLSMSPYDLAAPICMAKDSGAKAWLALHRLPLRQVTNCRQQVGSYQKSVFRFCAKQS